MCASDEELNSHLSLYSPLLLCVILVSPPTILVSSYLIRCWHVALCSASSPYHVFILSVALVMLSLICPLSSFSTFYPSLPCMKTSLIKHGLLYTTFLFFSPNVRFKLAVLNRPVVEIVGHNRVNTIPYNLLLYTGNQWGHHP